MPSANITFSKEIGDLIDRVEQFREELLAIQHSMEQMERAQLT